MDKRPYWPALLNLGVGLIFIAVGVGRLQTRAGRFEGAPLPFRLFPYLWLGIAVWLCVLSVFRFLRGPKSSRTEDRGGYIKDEGPRDKALRLKELSDLEQAGLITPEEYERKRHQILDDI